MKKSILLGLIGLIAANCFGQNAAYYADGYLLYGKDTSRCKIWFNPASPYFNKSITVWQNDRAVNISLIKNQSLTGFGITDNDYDLHYGKIEFDGKKGKADLYVLKIVAGVLELYEYHYVLFATLRGTIKTTQKDYFNYYLKRTDTNPDSYPTLLSALTKKNILPFINDNKTLSEEIKEKLTPEELFEVVVRYNKEKFTAKY